MPPILNTLLYPGLLLLHVVSMAVWFGGGFGLPNDIRKTLARGKPHTEMLAARVNRALGLATLAAIITIGTGFGLIFAKGGFASVPHRIHAGMAIALVSLGVLLFMIRPRAAQLEKALASGEGKDLRTIQKRIGMATGIDHLLKLIVIVLMVVPIESLRH